MSEGNIFLNTIFQYESFKNFNDQYKESKNALLKAILELNYLL